MRIGYALVRIETGEILTSFADFPPILRVPGTKDDFLTPHAGAEINGVRIVERWLETPAPTGPHSITSESETFDGERLVVSRQYEVLPPPVPSIISDRQFAHALKRLGMITHAEALAFVQTGTIPVSLQAIVDAISDQGEREDAELLLSGATSFERQHPMTEALRIGTGKTPEEIDDIWRIGAAL